jgi:hypothetical protein
VEPAGKVRVFAMVDPFTQWLLRPLHEALFALFRQIRQDGTHNQVKPLIALIKEREVLIRENISRFPAYGLGPTGVERSETSLCSLFFRSYRRDGSITVGNSGRIARPGPWTALGQGVGVSPHCTRLLHIS